MTRYLLMSILAPLLAAGSALTVKATALTDAIAHAESDFGRNQGRAGWHQMSPAAWQDVSNARKAHGKPEIPYSKVTDYHASTEYCQHYLTILYRQFEAEQGHPPKLEDLLACYNAGFQRYKDLGFDWHKLGGSFRGYVSRVKHNLSRDY